MIGKLNDYGLASHTQTPGQSIVFIGWLVWIAGYVWFIYRLVVGFINLLEEKPVSTTSWF